MQGNPFRISGIVADQYFIDRADELRSVLETMRGQGEMLVYGKRRMGKSSILLNAGAQHRTEQGKVVYADISPATSLTANIILHAFNQETGGSVNWIELLRQIQIRFANSQGIPALDVSLKKESPQKQLACLAAVLTGCLCIQPAAHAHH